MAGFADTTEVPPERTRAEIETTLRKYRADSFMSGWDAASAYVAFRAHDRLIRFRIDLPDPTDERFTRKNPYQKQPDGKAAALYDQAVRTIWRRLLLCIRAKLESVASGIETFETAFAAHIVLPTGQTVGEWIAPQIAAAYATGSMPDRLALPPARDEPRVLPHPSLDTGTDP